MNRRAALSVAALSLVLLAGCGNGRDTEEPSGELVRGVITTNSSSGNCDSVATPSGQPLTGAKVAVVGRDGEGGGVLQFDSYAGPASELVSNGVCAWKFSLRAPNSGFYSVQIADMSLAKIVSAADLTGGSYRVDLSAETVER